jgi:hypothetical protein
MAAEITIAQTSVPDRPGVGPQRPLNLTAIVRAGNVVRM